ncbi:MAG: hypothetical protein JO235_03325 [Chroococcidiopsidaceae cyanobacterium CP_BM_RX_35]|nr:hypothetical protein [Chroococcidiopsidaceae cyanobacterium CP_BM_RX_35]
MTTFAQHIDLSQALQSQQSYLDSKGYYQDNGCSMWEPSDPVDAELEKRFGPGAATRGEIDDYNWSDCEEF